jgi:ketosteroid isomerase-like protein
MKKLLMILPLVFLLCFTFGCQKQGEKVAEEPALDVEAEKQNVEEVIRNFYDAASTHNYQGIRDLCTDDYILFESGQVMNVEDFINFITPFEGATMTYNLEDVKTNVEDSVAWIRLRSKAKSAMGEQVMNFEWLESAVLKKQEGIWKIAFYHSTTVEPPEEK